MSTNKEEIIRDEGGAETCTFEFTEWPDTIPSELHNDVKENGLFQIHHVIDLVFICVGSQKSFLRIKRKIKLAFFIFQFCGSGMADKNVLFNYHADCEA